MLRERDGSVMLYNVHVGSSKIYVYRKTCPICCTVLILYTVCTVVSELSSIYFIRMFHFLGPTIVLLLLMGYPTGQLDFLLVSNI